MATHAAAKANALRRAEASLHIEVEHLLTRGDGPLHAPPKCATNATAIQKLTTLIHTMQQKYGDARAVYGSKSRPAIRINRGHNLLSEDDIGAAIELMLSPVSKQNRGLGGEGSRWFGVDTLQNPVDAAVIADMLWMVKPEFVLEIGTECGGSSVFLAQMLKLIHGPAGRRAQVLTYDVQPIHRRFCSVPNPATGAKRDAGVHSALWQQLHREGWLSSRIANVASPTELELIYARAAAAQTTLIIDDGDHTATPLIVHFELLAHLVTPGSYYLVQDTRLDRTCDEQVAHVGEKAKAWAYCNQILGPDGGPARAVQYLSCESAGFRRAFAIDRSMERYIFTQHPGGWLRRVRHNESALAARHAMRACARVDNAPFVGASAAAPQAAQPQKSVSWSSAYNHKRAPSMRAGSVATRRP